MSNAIQQYTVDDTWRMAQFIAKPGMFGIKSPEQAMALMLVAQAEGRHPATVAMEYDLIQGKPALKAKAKLARFQQAGGIINWIERSDTVAAAEFSHPSSPKPLLVRWDMERAKLAQLTGKDNWRKFPAQMLSARAISEGVDAVYPACGGLMYVAEEVQDFDDKPRGGREVQVETVPTDTTPTVTIERTTGKEAAKEFAANLPTRTVPPPTEPEAAELDAKINGPQVIDLAHEVPTALKPRKMVKLADLDREHAERALKLATWQVEKTKEFSAQHNEGTKNIPILKKLLASMPGPIPDEPVIKPTPPVKGSEAPESLPAVGTTSAEGASEPVEADVLTAKSKIFVRVMGEGKKQRLVTKPTSEMTDADLQDAYDANEAALSDPEVEADEKGKRLGVKAHLEKEFAKRTKA